MKKRMTRRSFLYGSTGLLTFSSCDIPGLSGSDSLPVPYRKRLPNPYVENGKPIVVIVHGTEYAPMLAKGMEMLGGFAKFGTDKAIHLKPNFVSAEKYPVTTDGQSLIETVKLLQKEGFKDITIAEWGTFKGKTEAFSFYELDQKVKEGGFKIKDLHNNETVMVKDSRWKAMPSVNVFKSSYEAPLIINMPTIKQHSLIHFTCGLKNTMGQISLGSRMDMHHIRAKYLFDSSESRLNASQLAVGEIASAINPEMTIIDARECMGKSHHFKGGIVKRANRLIISGDILAADIVASEVLAEVYDGFSTKMAKLQLNHAASLGLGISNTDNVVIKETTI